MTDLISRLSAILRTGAALNHHAQPDAHGDRSSTQRIPLAALVPNQEANGMASKIDVWQDMDSAPRDGADGYV